jgi:hypothetical protein
MSAQKCEQYLCTFHGMVLPGGFLTIAMVWRTMPLYRAEARFTRFISNGDAKDVKMRGFDRKFKHPRNMSTEL